MVAIKTHQASAYLNALDRVPQAVLFYGSDVGLGVGAGRPTRQGARWAR